MTPRVFLLLSLLSLSSAARPSTPPNAKNHHPLTGESDGEQEVVHYPGWFGRKGSTVSHTHTGLDGMDHHTEMPQDFEEVAKAKNEEKDPEKDGYHNHDMHSYGSHSFSCSSY